MSHDDAPSIPPGEHIDRLCAEFEKQWLEQSEPPTVERFLAEVDFSDVERLFRRLLPIDALQRQQRRLDASAASYRKRFPDCIEMIDDLFQDDIPQDNGQSRPQADVKTDAPAIGKTILKTRDFDDNAANSTSGNSDDDDFDHDGVPSWIGRYAVDRLLGSGGFGRVYLARDTDLERLVALKVPHRHRIATAEDVERFLDEARTLASLDHPGVVPIYDFDRFEDRCYVVTKYIAGETLAERLDRLPLSAHESVEMLRSIAQTLQYIHAQGVVHRDLKPGNLLIDKQGRCFVTDFGLALRDINYGQNPGRMGTVNYMSPEQARGEGHLVDGRSDLFSLGVLMYTMLTGVLPFSGPNWQAVIDLICHHEPKPLRQRQQSLPKELERICLRLLCKRASDRYLTASDLVDDFTHFLADGPIAASAPEMSSMPTGNSRLLDSQQQLVGIVPHGLRSFDQEDAAFFRELLPGPRDRDGLPDSLQFWKRRIESADPVDLFRVGVIYGPSGSGKSSFIKAGLLPTLESRLTVVFIEASAADTDSRLLIALRLRCPDIPTGLNLIDSFAWIRRQVNASSRRKVLIVIDQFEQWLHAHHEVIDPDLAVALRQCDGSHLQCVLLVRDDFWLAVSRLAEQIEVDLVPTRNLAMIDLFDKRHARKVLAEYGRAYARLPDNLGGLSKDQNAFLDYAIDGLAEAGKLIPIRLATFAEIMKGRDWTTKSLGELGGIEGVGVRFLEESFSTSNAPAQNQSHERAVQAILKSLLPEADTNIKGAMRSESELRTLSGYEAEPRRFDQMLSVLDTDLKLITPCEASPNATPLDDDESDPEQFPLDSESMTSTVQFNPQPATRYYQLTHDFLVPAVRSWLERRQQLTLRGRAAMRLADRADVWTSRPERRHLPSWIEWVSFLGFTKSSQRNTKEQKLIAAATKRHTLGTALTLGVVAMLMWAGFELRGRSRAAALTEQLSTASTTEVPRVLNELDAVGHWSTTPLSVLRDTADVDTVAGLHARLALLRREPDNQELFDTLGERLLSIELDQLLLLRGELHKHARMPQLTERLWTTLDDTAADPEPRFRAALSLATFDPPTNEAGRQRWAAVSDFIAADALRLTRESPRYYGMIVTSLTPARVTVLPPLRAVFQQPDESTERGSATNLVIDLSRDDPALLIDAFLDAHDSQLPAFLEHLDPVLDKIEPALRLAIATSPDPAADGEAQEFVSNRQVNAAALLFRHGDTDGLWSLFKHNPIPNTRSGLIERAVALGVDPDRLIGRLPQTTDTGIHSALLLMLGTFEPDALNTAQRDQCQTMARDLFTTHPSADVHAASGWLLRRRGDDAWIARTIDDLGHEPADPDKWWTVNSQGQTFVRIDRLDHPYEISTTEVTVEQFLRFRPDHNYAPEKAPDPRCPIIQTNWFDATEYCRWLTEQEGLSEDDQCYPPQSAGEDAVHLYDDYQSRQGYRLPTTEEWEAACFGNAKTRYFFGWRENLLDNYTTIVPDNEPLQSHVVGDTKPSTVGLYGMLTNVSEWCSNLNEPTLTGNCSLRGSTYRGTPQGILMLLRSGMMLQGTHFYSIGFRIVR